MSQLTKIVNTIILTGAVGLSSIIGQPNRLYGESGVKEKTKKEQVLKYPYHDHSEKFYDTNYSFTNINSLKTELNQHPSAMGYIRLSDLYFQFGKVEDAGSAAKFALSLDPKCIDAYVNLSTYYDKIGKLKDSLEIALKGDLINSEDPGIKFAIGISYYKFGSYNTSLNYFNKAIKLDPKCYKAIRSRNVVLKRIQNP